MEEKIVIESKFDEKWKKILLLTAVGLLVGGLLIAYILLCGERGEKAYGMEYDGVRFCFRGYTKGFTESEHIHYYFDDLQLCRECRGWNIFDLFAFEGVLASIFAITFTVFSLVTFISFLILSKSKLTITDMGVKGRTMWGKEVVLPLSMISAYSTRKFLSKVSVATSSGFVHFGFIENYKEMGETLKQLIAERQRDTEISQEKVYQITKENSGADEIKKYKELLDNGIITQEEFDAKKKQILGL